MFHFVLKFLPNFDWFERNTKTMSLHSSWTWMDCDLILWFELRRCLLTICNLLFKAIACSCLGVHYLLNIDLTIFYRFHEVNLWVELSNDNIRSLFRLVCFIGFNYDIRWEDGSTRYNLLFNFLNTTIIHLF